MNLGLTASSDTNKRRDADFYPTPPDVTVALIEFMRDYGVLNIGSTVWEPACGDGAMADVLKRCGYVVDATDIRHTGYGLGGVDFLVAGPRHCDAIITNPPFKLASEFIAKAVGNARVVAMVLKSQYWHAGKRTQLFREYPPAYVLALNWRPDFLNGERGGAPTMECLWTVWVRGQTDTRYRILQRPKRGVPL